MGGQEYIPWIMNYPSKKTTLVLQHANIDHETYVTKIAENIL
jgi:hypothetical protein